VDDRKQYSPSAARNLGPITSVVLEMFPKRGRVLEIASGSGQHVVALAEALPDVAWQPSDPDAAARWSIAVWIAATGRLNVEPPQAIDVTRADWEASVVGPFDGIVCINMLHISPWAACRGLMRGAGATLTPGGLLYLYGAYRRGGRHTVPSNAEFDASLRLRNPQWGVRNLEDVEAEARSNGLDLAQVIEMPNNNLSLVFRRRG
jgi:cyclopropane fatty-acyl-phospholipid synthase-like methyltransferase